MNTMFCPKCGKGEQATDSYCRNCGQFLADFSGKLYLVNKLLGGQKPETQVTVSLVINVVTIFISMLLLGFLNGFYDAQFERTQVGPPKVIYLVYAFLGLITIWQLFSFVVGMRLRSKVGGRKNLSGDAAAAAGISEAAPPSLSAAAVEASVESVTENTTRQLEHVPRK